MKKFIGLAFVALFFWSCDHSSSVQDEALDDDARKSTALLNSVEVSDPEDDPYFIENVNLSYRKLALSKSKTAEDSARADSATLDANYLHVRFRLQGKREAYELAAGDTSLILFEHPLDFKAIEHPVAFADSGLKAEGDSAVSLFAVVPADYEFGTTKYEVIRELFLVAPLSCDDSRDTVFDFGITLQELERDVLKEFENQECETYGGQLKFKDDQLGDQSVEGLKILGGDGYFWRKTLTDRDGKFQIPGKWKNEIEFLAQFQSEEFALRNGHSGYDEILTVSSEGPQARWEQVFSGTFAQWSLVWTAARQYWYGERFGLNQPRHADSSKTPLSIFVYYKDDDAMSLKVASEGRPVAQYMFGHSWIDPENSSKDYLLVLSYNRYSRDVYHTVIHEAGHFSLVNHCDKMPDKSINVPYMETFSRGVEWFFTNRRYCSDAPNDVCSVLYQHNYSGLIQDLIDTDLNAGDQAVGIDFVSGFTVAEVEQAMVHSTNFESMQSYLAKNFPANEKRRYDSDALDMLFRFWKSY